jgi:hypothetical protein
MPYQLYDIVHEVSHACGRLQMIPEHAVANQLLAVTGTTCVFSVTAAMPAEERRPRAALLGSVG